ncbi:hypothetical protein [Hymenobacter volaticus]|uniref:Rhodanese-like domain-containing protein n=1 Tax=Hymenobacter volaticus TaxID=2932254 RepID=A0ABY4GBS9_9BACT|nr:hypothetical protein [Hymenobacter volaticus]UOQ68225.1 hypothetical protein MUN86_10450 [Hymenobacter volaticus]
MSRFLVLAFLGLFGFMSSALAQTTTPFAPPATVVEMLKKPRTVLLDVRTPRSSPLVM